MKPLIILTSLVMITSLSSNDLSWVDEQVDAIKPKRDGISNSAISRIKNPFIYLKKEDKKVVPEKKEPNKSAIPIMEANTKSSSNELAIVQAPKPKLSKEGFYVSTIINQSALINGTWYKKGDNIKGYMIETVNRKSIVLSKGNKKRTLSTNSATTSLKFTNQ